MPKLYVGVTDKGWFNYLSQFTPVPKFVNFWKPSGKNKFKAIDKNELFLFKLKGEADQWIVGGGYFKEASHILLSDAWSRFGTNNGLNSLEDFRRLIAEIRQTELEDDPEIGYRLLENPFFWSREDWIPAPEDFSRNTVSGKTYDTESSTNLDEANCARKLWHDVMSRIDSRLRTY